VLGFVNRECSFTSVVFEGSITSAVVVASIDHFISTLQYELRANLPWLAEKQLA
jgi:hypothetical protein